MKLSLRASLLALALAVATPVFAADRWSSDEVAVRMGVNSWLSFWARPATRPSALELKGLYAIQPSDSLPAVVRSASQSGSLPSTVNQPERVAVQMQGDRATTTFDLDSQRSTQVVLTWERRSGLWRIVQETIKPASDTAGRIALSEPNRK